LSGIDVEISRPVTPPVFRLAATRSVIQLMGDVQVGDEADFSVMPTPDSI